MYRIHRIKWESPLTFVRGLSLWNIPPVKFSNLSDLYQRYALIWVRTLAWMKISHGRPQHQETVVCIHNNSIDNRGKKYSIFLQKTVNIICVYDFLLIFPSLCAIIQKIHLISFVRWPYEHSMSSTQDWIGGRKQNTLCFRKEPFCGSGQVSPMPYPIHKP